MEKSFLGSSFSRLCRDFLYKHGKQLTIVILLTILAGSLVGVTVKLIGWVVDILVDGRYVFDGWTITVLACIFGVFLLRGIMEYLHQTYSTRFVNRIKMALQYGFYQHIMRMDYSFFQRAAQGDLISRFTNDIQVLTNVLSGFIQRAFKDAITLVVLIALLFWNNWVLGAVVFFIFPLSGYLIMRSGSRLRVIAADTQKKQGHFTRILFETFQGIRYIKAANAADLTIERVFSFITQILELDLKAVKRKSIPKAIIEVLIGLGVIFILMVFMWVNISYPGSLSAGALIEYITIFMFAYEPLKRLAHLQADLQAADSASSRYYRVIDEQPKIRDFDDNKAADLLTGAKAPKAPGSVIEWQDVVFSFGHAGVDGHASKHDDYDQTWQLGPINQSIEKGSKIAIVGGSGSGKTTLLNLLLRFFDIQNGHIFIKGKDIRQHKIKDIRSMISLVSQDIFLFHDSIRHNMLFGLDRSPTQADYDKALHIAAADEFINAMLDKDETVVGDGASNISGGQKQRLSLVRALLQDRDLLLLDEASSALDRDTEKKVMDRLLDYVDNKEKTMIMITHRLEHLDKMDQIWVMQNGQIIEQGDYQSLMNTKGTLYHMIKNV